MPKLGEAYVVIRAALAPLRAGLSAARSIVVGAMTTINNTIKKMAEVGWKYTKRLAVGISGAMLGSVYAFGKFEAAMRKATAVSDVTGAQFKKMSMMAREQAMRLNMGAHDLAEGFYFLGSAGLSASQQIAAFVPVATMAKAATIGMGEAAEMTVDTMKGFGIAFSDTTRVTDIMAKTVTSSNQTFSQLGTSLSMVAGIAKNAHNTLEETNTALAIMADVGIKGSRSGMMLRRALLNLMAPMSDMRKQMDKLGIAVYDATTGQMKPFFQIVQEMGVALKGVSEEERNMAFKTIFGARAVAGQIAIFNKSKREIDAFVKSLREAGGYAEQVARKQLNSLAEQFGRLRKIVRDSAITFGSALAPVLRFYVDQLQDAAMAFNTWVRDQKFKIMEWAANIATWVNFARKTVYEFGKWLVTNWPEVWRYVFDTIKAHHKAGWETVKKSMQAAYDILLAETVSFGKSLYWVFRKIFQDIAINIGAWIEEAYAKKKAIKILTKEIYDELAKKEFGGRGLPLLSPSITATVKGRQKLKQLWKEAGREAAKRVEELGEGYTVAIKKEFTTWESVFAKIRTEQSKTIEYIRMRMKNLGEEIARIEKEIMSGIKPPEGWGEIPTTLERLRKEMEKEKEALAAMIKALKDADKAAVDAIGDMAKATKEGAGGIGVAEKEIAKKAIEFVGPKEMWKKLASGFAGATVETQQLNQLGAIRKATERTAGQLAKIETNTRQSKSADKGTSIVTA